MVFTLFEHRFVDGGLKMADVIGNEVWQVRILGVVPALLYRIQFRSVCRQPLKLEPIGVMFLETCCRREMDAQAIPNQDHFAAIMIMQLPE